MSPPMKRTSFVWVPHIHNPWSAMHVFGVSETRVPKSWAATEEEMEFQDMNLAHHLIIS